MTDLYLVAHKVRDEPAFDVATRMICPVCIGEGQRYELMTSCHECDGLGYWWIIPTSGHRAYPFHAEPLDKDLARYHEAMPPDLPDHYTTRVEPKVSLADRLGLAAKPQPPLKRRF